MSDIPNIYLNDPDPLSVLLTKLNLTAEIYVNGDFCGTWAVDTGGSKRIPFHLISSGQAWLHLDNEEPQCLHQHDLVIFPHDAHHILSNSQEKPAAELVNAAMTNDGETTNMICGFFEFKNPALFPILDALPTAVILRSEQHVDSNHVALLINMMCAELKRKQLGCYTSIDHMAFLIFIEVLRQQMKSGSIKHGLLNALFDPRLGKALNAMHQFPESSWTLESLAAEALMSRASFADAFSKTVGLSPMKYLTKWRLSEARRLLKTTHMSVAQIAEQSGYATEAAFRKAYKNTLGETPGVVRT